MASTKKIVVALAVLKAIFKDEQFSLDTQIKIKDEQFCAGMPTNELDRYFFAPWYVTKTNTIDELLSYIFTDSDNTSTDVLIDLIGGTDKINEFAQSLNLSGHKLSFSTKQLLANYFGLTTERTFANIGRALWELPTAFSLRPTEQSMVFSEEDVCTPQMIADLLKLLIQNANEENWLSKATKVLFSKMEGCVIGGTLIKKGAEDLMPNIKAFDAKQGGLGGIRNDTAFIHFEDGRWAIISIHTCLSDRDLASRDEIIAKIANKFLIKDCGLSFITETDERRLSL